VAAPRPEVTVPDFPAADPPPSRSQRARRELLARPTQAMDHASVAAGAMDRGAWEEAANAYRRALALDPGNARYEHGLAAATAALVASTTAP
jgi:cytochrome c-type biogenesis protein CcmH/NrfG